MPRQITENLVGYGIAVDRKMVQQVDPKDGQPLHDGRGDPILGELTTLVIVEQGGMHVVKYGMNEETRRALVEQLSSGLVLARANGQPK